MEEDQVIFNSCVLKYTTAIILDHACTMYDKYTIHIKEHMKVKGPKMATNYFNYCTKCICNLESNININHKFSYLKSISNISELTLLTMLWMIILKTYNDMDISSIDVTNKTKFCDDLKVLLNNILRPMCCELIDIYSRNDPYDDIDVDLIDPDVDMFTIHRCNHLECGSVCILEPCVHTMHNNASLSPSMIHGNCDGPSTMTNRIPSNSRDGNDVEDTNCIPQNAGVNGIKNTNSVNTNTTADTVNSDGKSFSHTVSTTFDATLVHNNVTDY